MSARRRVFVPGQRVFCLDPHCYGWGVIESCAETIPDRYTLRLLERRVTVSLVPASMLRLRAPRARRQVK